MRRHWWASEASSVTLTHLASLYIGPALFVAGVLGVTSLRIAAAVVCVFGIAETVQLALRQQLHPLAVIASIVGHVVVWLPYAGKPFAPVETWVHSAALLLTTLGVYAALGAWPYTLSPAVAMALGLATGLVATT